MRSVNQMSVLEAGQAARKTKDDGASTALPSVIEVQTVSPRLLGLKSAGGYLSLSYWTVRELVWRGELPSIRVGRRILVDREDLDAFIDRNKLTESM